MTSRVRIWVFGTPYKDYLTLRMAGAYPHDSAPGAVIADRLDREHYLYPPASPDCESYVNRLDVVIRARDCYLLNATDPPGGTSYRLFEWLDYYVRQHNNEVYVFTESIGTDSGGVAVDDCRYYRGRFLRPLPPWLMGLRTNAGGATRELTLTLLVDEEGTFADFDDLTSITPGS